MSCRDRNQGGLNPGAGYEKQASISGRALSGRRVAGTAHWLQALVFPPKAVLMIAVFVAVLACSKTEPQKHRSALPPSAPGQFNILNQEPVADVPYPNSFVSKRLPDAGRGGPMSHLLANSDGIVTQTLRVNSDGTITDTTDAFGSLLTEAPSNTEGAAEARYYGQHSPGCRIGQPGCDPAYIISGCIGYTAAYNGKIFHAPSQAEASNNCRGATGCSMFDSQLDVWDQPSQRLFSFYYGHSNSFPRLPACPGGHAGTDTDPCPFPAPNDGSGCAYDDRSLGRGYHAGFANTNGLSPEAGGIRFQEFMSGHINHAIYLNTSCTAGDALSGTRGTVFPASDGGYTAGTCAAYCSHHPSSAPCVQTTPPPNGALFFLDYTASQLVSLKTALPAPQYVVLEALTLYGGYVGDTGGEGGGLYFKRPESAQAYYYYDVVSHQYPGAYTDGSQAFSAQTFFNWMTANCWRPSCKSINDRMPGNKRWEVFLWLHVPADMPGPSCSEIKAKNKLCGIGRHLHIAEECVARALAGRERGCDGVHRPVR